MVEFNELQSTELEKEINQSQPQRANKRIIFFGLTLILVFITAITIYILLWRNDNIQRQKQTSLPSSTINPVSPIYSPPTVKLNTYTNSLYGYSFKYTDSLGIQWTGISDDSSDSDFINLSPIEKMGEQGMEFKIVTSMSADSFKTEKELVQKGIIDYYSASTANYLYPENNRIIEKIAGDKSYNYEIEWSDSTHLSNEADKKNGIDVIHIYPLDIYNYPIPADKISESRFLWVRYSKTNSKIYDPIIKSISVPQKKLGRISKIEKKDNMYLVYFYEMDWLPCTNDISNISEKLPECNPNGYLLSKEKPEQIYTVSNPDKVFYRAAIAAQGGDTDQIASVRFDEFYRNLMLNEKTILSKKIYFRELGDALYEVKVTGSELLEINGFYTP